MTHKEDLLRVYMAQVINRQQPIRDINLLNKVVAKVRSLVKGGDLNKELLDFSILSGRSHESGWDKRDS